MGLFDFMKKKPSIPPEALCLWVHRAEHLERIDELLEEQHGEGFPIRREVADLFGVVVGLSTTDGVVPVKQSQLDALQLDAKEAFERALANAQQSIGSLERADGVLIWQGAQANALVLLLPMLRKSLPLEGAPLLVMPREELVLVTGVDDPDGIAQLMALAVKEYATSERFVSLRPITWEGDSLAATEWLPPEGHPHFDLVLSALARTRKHEAEGLYHRYASEQAPLAHLAALPPEKGGGLVGAWARETNVVLPMNVDRVVLVDTDDEPMPRVEVMLETLLELFPHAFEAIPCGEELAEDEPLQVHEARLVRTRGVLFPTLSEKRFLVARQALLDASPEAAEIRDVPGAELLASWDAGDALVARHEADGVLLAAPDGRCSMVTEAEFGDRISKRGAQDRERFAQGKTVNVLMQLMLGEQAPTEQDLPNLVAAAEHAPPAPQEDGPRRPSLISANDLRHVREEPGPEGEGEVAALLAQHTLSSAEPARLFPLTRPPNFEAAQQANELGMVAGAKGEAWQVVHMERLTRDFSEGVHLELVSDAGDRVMPLDGRLFAGELADVAWRTAMLNLRAASVNPLHRRPQGFYEGPWHDDFDASRVLLLPSLARACTVKGEHLVFAPTVGRTWVVGSEDVPALTATLDAIEAHLADEKASSPYQFRQLLFGWPWVVSGETVRRWSVPASHPLAARIAALDATLQKRRKDSSQHIEGFARGLYSPLNTTKPGEA